MRGQQKQLNRSRRRGRIRARLSGTADRPRIAVFKSNRHMVVQAIDDVAHRTIVSSAKVSRGAAKTKRTKMEVATVIGTTIAEELKAKGITRAVFDRGGFKYHGRVKAVAEGLRSGGITI